MDINGVSSVTQSDPQVASKQGHHRMHHSGKRHRKTLDTTQETVEAQVNQTNSTATSNIESSTPLYATQTTASSQQETDATYLLDILV